MHACHASCRVCQKRSGALVESVTLCSDFSSIFAGPRRSGDNVALAKDAYAITSSRSGLQVCSTIVLQAFGQEGYLMENGGVIVAGSGGRSYRLSVIAYMRGVRRARLCSTEQQRIRRPVCLRTRKCSCSIYWSHFNSIIFTAYGAVRYRHASGPAQQCRVGRRSISAVGTVV